MDLLTEIEGLSGENLTTAVLRLLLLRSQDLREACMRAISVRSRVGPLAVDSHFSCISEFATDEVKTARRGRLDLLIETSDTVIGLENKILAPFQEGQPHKYLETVEQHAEKLSALRAKSLQHLVLVLAPRSREEEILGLVHESEHFVYLSWEDLLDAFGLADGGLDPSTSVLFGSLNTYLRQKVEFLPKFAELIPHLRQRFDEGGTSLQREVVRGLWGFFPDSGPRLSHGSTWAGYYFVSTTKELTGWYGFVPGTALLTGGRHAAELIVATSFEVPVTMPPFRPIELRVGKRFLGIRNGPIYCWAVDFDKSWSSAECWRNALAPLHGRVEQLLLAAAEAPMQQR